MMPEGRLPNFLCIGVPRSGTTWLSECLSAHPEAFVPALKEVSFFIRDEYRSSWDKGLDWYRSLFVSPEPGVKAWGELTVRYYFLERTPALIHDHIPDVKLIYMLRHPVEVLHSVAAYHLFMYPTAINSAAYGLHDFLNHHLAESLGFYARYFRRYLELFPRENILVLFYDDLNKSSRDTFATVCRFLGIDPTIAPDVVDRRINAPAIPRRYGLSVLLNSLAAPLGRVGGVLRRIDRRFNRVVYRQSPAARKNLVTPDIFERLMKVYEDDVCDLEGLTGRDLRHWFDYRALESAIRVAV
jgi:hypothetical protein